MSMEYDKKQEAGNKEIKQQKIDKDKTSQVEQAKVNQSRPDSQDIHSMANRQEFLKDSTISDRPTALTDSNSSHEERKTAAKKALPERFHSTIEKSEILNVMSAEQYNDRFRLSEHADGLEQLPAKEIGKLNVVEMKLGQDLLVGQVHGMNESGKPHHGKWFSEYCPSHQSPAEAKESFIIPPSSSTKYGKTHASFGGIKAGSTVAISEVGPRTFNLHAANEKANDIRHSSSKKAKDGSFRSTPSDALNPPLSNGPDVQTFQVELKGDSSNQFQAQYTLQLRRDKYH